MCLIEQHREITPGKLRVLAAKIVPILHLTGRNSGRLAALGEVNGILARSPGSQVGVYLVRRANPALSRIEDLVARPFGITHELPESLPMGVLRAGNGNPALPA